MGSSLVVIFVVGDEEDDSDSSRFVTMCWNTVEMTDEEAARGFKRVGSCQSRSFYRLSLS